jgi:nitroreductase
MKESKKARPDYPIEDLIAKRWSPYAFSEQPVSSEDLLSLFEAARWAASSYNEQPWRFFLATKERPAEFGEMLSCLVDGNKAWAQHAPVLALAVVSRRFERNDKPNPAAHHDLGAASASLTFEATRRGLSVHQMIGILPDRAREVFEIPTGFDPFTGLAIGYSDDQTGEASGLGERDEAPRTRRPLAEFVFSGRFGSPFSPGVE